ncbi:MAG: leucyl/phenylalanyl-tRNA--protein transferase [Gammaproteobacteria bacterium]|nr:leucyl/phenylalanyl-tRNA--protein transferase [Gammaproteobacteria bacterium]
MSKNYIPWIDPEKLEFPPVSEAWDEPNGILAAGGDLSEARLIEAYCHGVFPWYNEDEPILWWSPNPRCVLKPADLKVSKSLRKTINKKKYAITFDHCFSEVISACATGREAADSHSSGTWISAEMKQAYIGLHQSGYAHSVECWLGKQLVGGLYGLAIGKVFFGESMFSRENDASKVAFATLCEKLTIKGFELIDGQVYSPHLETLGFTLIERSEFVASLKNLTNKREKSIFNRSLIF